MTIQTRGARPHEYPAIRSLIGAAFKGDEADLFDHLIHHDPALSGDAIRVALKEDEPVAVTCVLPRQIRTRRGWAPGGIITLVACRPDLQGQGYGSATVRDALAWMGARGLAVAILYGRRHFYPRFGFAPVLPHYETVLPSVNAAVPLTRATEADLPWMTELYTEQLGAYPCAVARTAAPWLWALRAPSKFALFTLPDQTGYAFAALGPRLDVHEAAAATPEAARRLLAGLRTGAGVEQVSLLLPPSAAVAVAARAEGAETVEKPAAAGMAYIIDWAAVLPDGYAVTAGGLTRDGRLVVAADRTELTQIAMGCHAAPGLERDCPRWSLAPFWYA